MTPLRTLPALLALTLLLVACDTTEEAPDAQACDGDVITVEMGDMYFEPESVEVAAGETVTFEAGEFDADTVGWCDVPGHREAGMELEEVVE